ncbi:MAG: hypothetical protein LBT80_07865 [Lactobacillaceae bacterium]|jgi:hypothetical protein|nr:hypothetical protein [Lactobacillaceae bacterium]
MTKYMHVTYGSKAILTEVIKKHPTHQLHLATDEQDDKRYQLFEITEQANSVFASAITYEIIDEVGQVDDVRGWMNWTFITLNDEERDNFLRRWKTMGDTARDEAYGWLSSRIMVIPSTYDLAIMSTWTLRKEFFNWNVEHEWPIKQYVGKQTKYNYREKGYRFAALTK